MRDIGVMALWFALIAGTILAAHCVVERTLIDAQSEALAFQLAEQERVLAALRDSIDAVRANCTAKCNMLQCFGEAEHE